jgi:hypothetical protein
MATSTKKKTVAFFEITDENGSPLGNILPWQEILTTLEQQNAAQCCHAIFGVDHYVRIYAWEGRNHLVLARARDDSPSTLDLRTSAIVDEVTQAGRPWVEVSVVSFIPGTNRLGFVLGGQASPHASSLERWINAHDLMDEDITISPVVNRQILDILDKENVEARLVTVRLDPGQFISQDDAGGLVSYGSAMGREIGGDYQIEMTVKIQGRADHVEPGRLRRLGALGRQLLGRDVAKAVVQVVDLNGDGVKTEMLDLLHYKLARKEKISVTDEEGNPVRIPSALTAIMRAADHYGHLLTTEAGIAVRREI